MWDKVPRPRVVGVMHVKLCLMHLEWQLIMVRFICNFLHLLDIDLYLCEACYSWWDKSGVKEISSPFYRWGNWILIGLLLLNQMNNTDIIRANCSNCQACVFKSYNIAARKNCLGRMKRFASQKPHRDGGRFASINVDVA